MEAEEEWNKDLSAHKLLDKKVLCKQNGRIGKTVKYLHPCTQVCLLSLPQGDLSICRYSENSSQPVENTQHTADSVHHPLRMCW